MFSKFFAWLLSDSTPREFRPDTPVEELLRPIRPITNSTASEHEITTSAVVESTTAKVASANETLETKSITTDIPAIKAEEELRTTGLQRRPKRVPKPRADIELRIGFDVGTSCTKALIGNDELGKQTAVPIDGAGKKLRDYLLPTRVFLLGDVYSLEQSFGGQLVTNLKLKLLESSNKGQRPRTEDYEPLVAFVALALHRILKWHEAHYSEKHHPGRLVKWSLSVGLPSKRPNDDVFAPIYTKIVRAAVLLIGQNCEINRENVHNALNQPDTPAEWLPKERISLFPEASAQLTSLLSSPFCPEGCLLLVDVGAGTLDVSTLRVSATKTGANCFMHCSDVAPLGVHFLQIERLGLSNANNLDLSTEDVVTGFRSKRAHSIEEKFAARCKEALLATVARYRKMIKATHVSPTYKPWANGLTYILSGGGHRDEFYQELLKSRLRYWMKGLVGEWTDEMQGLKQEQFLAPPSFEPVLLTEHFDRFSVAHGLSRDPANLLNTGIPQ